jgi:uncharacterized protein YwqG
MAKRKTIAFRDSSDQIREPQTKFGGQPIWLTEPQWPLSRELGVPMRFIGQVAVPNDLFPEGDGKVVYIFMTDTDDYVDGTWEPNGGENAAIIQPAELSEAPIVLVEANATGPTIQRYVKTPFSKKLKPQDVELSVALSEEDEPDFISDSDKASLSDADNEKYWDAIQGNKIGGNPAFIQYDEFPDSETDWRLLLQLDSCAVPFHLNFGDAGIGHVFVDTGVTKARLLWQCS